MAIEICNPCIVAHGAPNRFSAKSDFTKGPMKRFFPLTVLNSQKKAGIGRISLDLSRGTIKRSKVSLKSFSQRSYYVPLRVSLQAWRFVKRLFQLECNVDLELFRGYHFAPLGASSGRKFPPLLNTYRDQEYVRSLQPLLRLQQPHTIHSKSWPRHTTIVFL